MGNLRIAGQIVNVSEHSVQPGEIIIENGVIIEIIKKDHAPPTFLVPGFVDAHVHIESSMLIPSEFARLATVHGTVATVSDPHEIGNVLGIEGVQFMIENSRKVNFKSFFGAPSCVPATPFETAGSQIGPDDIELLLKSPDIYYLAEMMNWPGVLQRQEDVMAKIKLAHKYLKPVDGHAPGLRGLQAKQYAEVGITTDHECFTKDEALDKLACGMKIIIREGSAAKNFDALIDLLPQYVDQIMFCSDDKHPDNLVEGHINLLLKRGIKSSIDPLILLQAASKNPIDHYKLPVGLLNEGDPADFAVVSNLQDFEVQQTFINGVKVAEKGVALIPSVKEKPINKFDVGLKSVDDFKLKAKGDLINVIVAEDGQLITKKVQHRSKIENGYVVSDLEQDVLKITVVNRYHNAPVALGFIKNFGLKRGAIASSVAHDSHNIIAVGVDDKAICKAVNEVIKVKGGISVTSNDETVVLPLPIAGLMSSQDGYTVAQKYTELDQLAKSYGSTLTSPFMTLSFMALLVIPEIKLSDQGLFDGNQFQFMDLSV